MRRGKAHWPLDQKEETLGQGMEVPRSMENVTAICHRNRLKESSSDNKPLIPIAEPSFQIHVLNMFLYSVVSLDKNKRA